MELDYDIDLDSELDLTNEGPIVEEKGKKKKEAKKLTTLTPLYLSTSYANFGVVDIEVQGWRKHIVSGMFYKKYKNAKSGHFEYFDTPQELLYRCIRMGKAHKIKDWVAHFGGKFDFLYFLQACVDFRHIFKVETMLPRGSGLLCFKMKLRKGCEKYGYDYVDYPITFRDSSALLPFGLKSITKTFGVEAAKGEIDFDFIEHVYKSINYHELLWSHVPTPEHYGYIVFNNGVQSQRKAQKLEGVKYWNLSRYPLVPREIPHVWSYVKRFKKPVMEFLYPLFTRKDLLEYLRKDCEGLHQSLEKFFSWNLVADSKPAWTTASQAVQVLRSFIRDDIHSLPKEVDTFVRQAYYGGRTEIFKVYFDNREEKPKLENYPNKYNKENKDESVLYTDDKLSRSYDRQPFPPSCGRQNRLRKPVLFHALFRVSQSTRFLKCFDANSLYPTVMQKFTYPNAFRRWLKGKKDYSATSHSIWKVKVMVPDSLYIPPLGTITTDGKFIFPTGIFEGQWTNHEIEYAKSLGVEVLEYYIGAEFDDGGYIFKNFIDTLYQIRLDAQAKKDDMSQMMAKLLMNSCYGRMGLNPERVQLEFENGQAGVRHFSDINSIDGTQVRIMQKDVTLDNAFTNVSIAAFVTSYSRVWMHKKMMDIGPHHLYYTDTDSVFIDKDIPSGKDLGEFKLEYKAEQSIFLLPKTYSISGIFDDKGKAKAPKIAMKGFDAKKVFSTFRHDDFINFLHGELPKLQMIMTPRFGTMKTSMRMGRFVEMMYDPEVVRQNDRKREQDYFDRTGKRMKIEREEYVFSKSIKSKYDKRIILGNNWETRPIKLEGTNENLESIPDVDRGAVVYYLDERTSADDDTDFFTF